MHKNLSKSERKYEIQAEIKANPIEIKPNQAEIKPNPTRIVVNESQIKPNPNQIKSRSKSSQIKIKIKSRSKSNKILGNPNEIQKSYEILGSRTSVVPRTPHGGEQRIASPLGAGDCFPTGGRGWLPHRGGPSERSEAGLGTTKS